MNKDNTFSHEDPLTLLHLQQLLPPKRCGLDGRVPVDEMLLPCGHVYCNLCVRDIMATAALVGQVPTCKVCYTDFRPSQIMRPSMANNLLSPEEVRRRRHVLSTGMAQQCVDCDELPSQMSRGSLGEQAGMTILSGPGQALPWIPLSRRVMQLLEKYTKPQGQVAQSRSLPEATLTIPQVGGPSSSMPQQSGLVMPDFEFGGPLFALPLREHGGISEFQGRQTGGEHATGAGMDDLDFDNLFDFDAEFGTGVDDIMSWSHGFDNGEALSFGLLEMGNTDFQAATQPQDQSDQMVPSKGKISSTAREAPSRTDESLQHRSPIEQTPYFNFHPLGPEIDLPHAPEPNYDLPCAQSDFPLTTPSEPPFFQPQPQTLYHNNTLYSLSSPLQPPPNLPPTPPSLQTTKAVRDISILAGERFVFKGQLQDQAAMEAAVRDAGGIITGGGFKHTSYGIVGPGWKVTESWRRNGVKILNEEGFWGLMAEKRKGGVGLLANE